MNGLCSVCRRRNAAHHAGRVIISRATGVAAQDLFIPNIPFFPRSKTVHGHFIGVLLAIANPPLGEQIVLDPENLVDGSNERDLASEGDMGVGEECFDEDILDKAHADVGVDEFNVEGM